MFSLPTIRVNNVIINVIVRVNEIFDVFIKVICKNFTLKLFNTFSECAALKEKYQRMKLIGPLIACDKQGYYEKKQCIGSVCHCVNKAGEKIQTETFPVSDFKNYNC